MNERTRNLAVGATALAALVGLGYMILLFGGAPSFAARGYAVTVYLPTGGALDEGANVRLNGIRIGTVTDVRLRDDPRQGVTVQCRIQRDIRIPFDTEAMIGRQGLGGGGYVHLRATVADEPAEPRYLPTDGTATLRGTRDDAGLLGPEFATQLDAIAEGFEAFSRLADTLNRALQGPDVDDTVDGLAGTIHRLNRVLDEVLAAATDPQSRENLRDSLANLRQATAAGVTAMDELSQFGRRASESLKGLDHTTDAMTDAARSAHAQMERVAAALIDDAERLGRLLTTLNQAATTLTHDTGTAGRILHDPALFNNLLESTEILANTLAELEATIGLWRREGVRINLR